MDSLLNLLKIFLMAIPAYLIVTGVHEFGHVLVGLMSGFRFELFVIGPFGLKRNEDGTIVFYIEKIVSLWGGCAATVPISEKEVNLEVFGRILLGGPLMTLAFTLMLLPIAILVDNMFIVLLMAMSFGIFVATIIPMRNGSFYTDGGRWLRIKRKGQPAKMEAALFHFIQSYMVHRNYSQIKESDTQYLKADSDSRNAYLGHYFSYQYFKDNARLEDMKIAKDALEALIPKVPKSFPKLFPIE